MELPFALPDWVPWWVPIVLLVPVLLYALALLLMPFSVFGVKGRLEAIEARLDEIQGEIRSLALRMPEPIHAAAYEELYPEPASRPRVQPTTTARPPIPPARPLAEFEDGRESFVPPPRPRRAEPVLRPQARPRSEPRLDWPDR